MRAAVVLVAIGALSLRASAEPSAREVVRKVQAAYSRSPRMTAHFTEVIRSANGDVISCAAGTVRTLTPARARWDYERRSGPRTTVAISVILNGMKLYVVELVTKQVTRASAPDDWRPVAVAFVDTPGRLGDVTLVRDDVSPRLVLHLAPTNSAGFKSATFVVDPATHLVEESVVVDASDHLIDVHFTDVDFAKSVREEWFFFVRSSGIGRLFRWIVAPAGWSFLTSGGDCAGIEAGVGSGAAPDR